MEGIVDDPHPGNNVAKRIASRNDLMKDLMQVEIFTIENFMLRKFEMGIMFHVKKPFGIVDGIEEKTYENEVDSLHKDNVCQIIIFAFVDRCQIMTCCTSCKMW